ncbi:MAG: hypothetical protein U0871_06360 [Gemmataceae bacterium]
MPRSSIPAGYPVFSATTSRSTRSTSAAGAAGLAGVGAVTAGSGGGVAGTAGRTTATGGGTGAGAGGWYAGAGGGTKAGAGGGANATGAGGTVPGANSDCWVPTRASRVRWASSWDSRNCLCSRAVCSCICCRAVSVCWVRPSAWDSPVGAGSVIGAPAAGGSERTTGAGGTAAGGRGGCFGRGATWFAPQIGTASPGGGASAGRHRLPSSQAASRTACPRAASRPSAWAKSNTPDRLPPDPSSGTAVVSVRPASARVASASRVSTVPGPTSTNVRTPAAAIARTWSANLTGLASWWPSSSRQAAGSSGYAAAVVLANTGADPAGKAIASRADRNGPAAAATRELWNAPATGSRTARTPAAANAFSARSTSGVGPDSTFWVGAFWLATTTLRECLPITASTSDAGAKTASIAPASPARCSAISRPRSRDRACSSSGLSRPAAARATSSP